MAKESHFGPAQNAFVAVDGETGGQETIEDLAQVSRVGAMIGASNQNVVQIDECKRQIPEGTVHETLERLD